MKLTRFRTRTRVGFGAFVDGGIVDLGARMATLPGVRALLKTGALDLAANIAARHGPDLGPDDYSFELPVDQPSKIVCIGVNYPRTSR